MLRRMMMAAGSVPPASDPYADAVIALSPYYYYKLNEASGAPQDSSGNSRHASISNGALTYKQASLRPDGLGNSVEFDGSDALSIPFSVSASAGWVAFFARPNFTSGYGFAFSEGGGSGPNFHIIPNYSGSTLRWQLANKFGASFHDLFSAGLGAGTSTRFVVCTWSNTVKKVYIDGTLSGNASVNGLNNNDNSSRFMGMEPRGLSSYNPYNGRIQDFAAGSGVLSDAQVTALWNAAGGI